MLFKKTLTIKCKSALPDLNLAWLYAEIFGSYVFSNYDQCLSVYLDVIHNKFLTEIYMLSKQTRAGGHPRNGGHALFCLVFGSTELLFKHQLVKS